MSVDIRLNPLAFAGPAIGQVTKIVTVSDVNGSLNNKYVTLNAPSGVVGYIWFNVNEAGTDPAPNGGKSLMVAVPTNASDYQIAFLMQSVLDVNLPLVYNAKTSPIQYSPEVTITNLAGGSMTALAGNAPFTFYVLIPGQNAVTPQGRFYGINPQRVIIPVGTGQPFTEFLGTPPMQNFTDRATGTFQLNIGIQPQTIATNLWTAMKEGGFNYGNIFTSLANLVDQNLVIVTVDGVVQTSNQILS